ncbi:hypothetical protein PCANC_27320 [Puccinia coronata f. sp. avenae]|nr:hypothetical protein PCANC_27320 [Puccinia coronata f. sp. avenae]
MPHNKHRTVTALLEPPLTNTSRSSLTSIHSPEALAFGRRASRRTTRSIQVSLYEAADQSIKWMTRLFKDIPPDQAILKCQIKAEVADPTLLNPDHSAGLKVSPDMHILDCATYFKQQLQARGGGVTLLTNDKALSLEAELEGISTLRIQPGLSSYSMLHSFDPTLAEDIETLIAQVSLADMITTVWYRKHSIPLSKPPPHRPALDDGSPTNLDSCSAYHLKPHPKRNNTMPVDTLDVAQDTIQADEPSDELSNHMAIEIDEEMSISDLKVPPLFPLVTYQHMLAPSPLYEPRLLHLHYHVQQAVAALLRPRLFDFLLCTLASNNISSLFQHVELVFQRKRAYSSVQSSQDPNKWTAVDCLTLIDEFWNDATLKLFEDDDNQCSLQARNASSSKPKSDSIKPLRSRWAPSTPFMNTDTNEQNCHTSPNRLSRIRKAIQVLIVQLQPYDTLNLPRDNPQSWSVLFWDGLLEDIHKLIYYGKFHASLSHVEDSRESQEHLLKKVIQSWKKEARHLCETERRAGHT